jgi:hypothetical protein
MRQRVNAKAPRCLALGADNTPVSALHAAAPKTSKSTAEKKKVRLLENAP